MVGETVNLERYMAVEIAHTLIEGDDFVLQNDEALWAYGTGWASGTIDAFPVKKGNPAVLKPVSSGFVANAPKPKKPDNTRIRTISG